MQGHTPLDLLSGRLKGFLTSSDGGARTEVYSWGNGANYQLGSGAVGMQLAPARLDTLHGLPVVQLCAAKFHSAALTADGMLYTWGFGRGGRLGVQLTALQIGTCTQVVLVSAAIHHYHGDSSSCNVSGHPEFHIHSGETAVILPRLVLLPGRRTVVAVAAGKHHTVAIVRGGELFTWGSNRDGRLGYTSVDSQPTPRRRAQSIPALCSEFDLLKQCLETWPRQVSCASA